MPTNIEKLRDLLQELFQLDQAELDFGIYRIMNQKRDEIVRFLDNDLLPQVKEAFGQYKAADKSEIQKELDKLIETINNAGMNPEDSPKVKELRQRLTDSSVDVIALENEVFSHLFNFFRRYYNEGDFLSLRRYKEGVYAIPYEGEEVKLHWANADQYYVKSSEYFRDYIFKTSSGKRVRVHLVAASTEQDNKKEATGQERRFILREENPISEEGGELFIHFEYRPSEAKEKQDALNQAAVQRILKIPGLQEWIAELSKPAPTEKKKDRTLLEKHLTQYAEKNTFDYFIHKDLGGFLRRELDFYIKNEVMHLDDIEHESIPKVEQYLSQIKVIRNIAHKIIDFLAQLENFQKRLWLKKKFVVETNYCITLDRVPESFYPEIVANDMQRDEWFRLFMFSELGEDISTHGSNHIGIDFLKAHMTLMLDTRHFPSGFVERLLATIDNLDEQVDGVAFHAENFQALSLMQANMRSHVKCIYIDPPYNTGQDGFAYKDSFKSASWAAMIKDRLELARHLLTTNGVHFASINEIERATLDWQLRQVYGAANRIEEVIWVRDTMSNNSPTYSTNHEYVEVFARNRPAVEMDRDMFRETKLGFSEVMSLIGSIRDTYPSVEKIEQALRQLYQEHRATHLEAAIGRGETPEEAAKSDPWKGLYPYKRAEYRDESGRLVDEENARSCQAAIWVWREVEPSMPAGKQADSIKDPRSDNYRFYRPPHPVTGRACKPPKRGWAFPQRAVGGRPSLENYQADNRIVFKEDENSIPQLKYFLHEVESVVSTSVVRQYADGEPKLEELFGRKGLIDNPKPPGLIERFVRQTVRGSELVLDYFAGSGTTAHSVINLNREDGERRRFVLVEVGHYFDTVLVPRVKKIVFSPEWTAGRPSRPATSEEANHSPHMIKLVRLESYEDALSNLDLKRTDQQGMFIDANAEMREQYILSYMLNVESRGSQSLLNVKAFRNPDQYKLRVERNGEMQLMNVDLVETFNWLLGLTVKHIDVIRGVRVIDGTIPQADRVLVLWRNLDELNNEKLDEWFEKQGYSTRDLEYDLVYVNGDNNLENLRRDDQTWKVRLIEEEFQRLMFDVQDV